MHAARAHTCCMAPCGAAVLHGLKALRPCPSLPREPAAMSVARTWHACSQAVRKCQRRLQHQNFKLRFMMHMERNAPCSRPSSAHPSLPAVDSSCKEHLPGAACDPGLHLAQQS
eukprot:358829-Chlamydomonas_euryale.AAC.3